MNITAIDTQYIQEVNQMAIDSFNDGFEPFAALLVLDGKVVSRSINKCIQYRDPTAHAEMTVISEHCRLNQQTKLKGYTIYCNVEPCLMCSGAIHWSRISKVVYGVSQPTLQSLSGGNPKPRCIDMVNVGGKQIEVVGPVLENENKEVLRLFFIGSDEKFHK